MYACTCVCYYIIMYVVVCKLQIMCVFKSVLYVQLWLVIGICCVMCIHICMCLVCQYDVCVCDMCVCLCLIVSYMYVCMYVLQSIQQLCVFGLHIISDVVVLLIIVCVSFCVCIVCGYYMIMQVVRLLCIYQCCQ